MKPDWKDAPEWANWLAMDADGWWQWFIAEPKLSDGMWMSDDLIAIAGKEEVYWAGSLQRRPQTTKPAEAGSEGQGD